MPYGHRWRLQRRFFHQTFKTESTSRFISMQQRKAHLLAHRILSSPDRVFEHIHEWVITNIAHFYQPLMLHRSDRFTSSVIINAIYDYDPVSPDDYMVNIIGRVCKLIAVVNTPEAAGVLCAFPMSKCGYLNASLNRS